MDSSNYLGCIIAGMFVYTLASALCKSYKEDKEDRKYGIVLKPGSKEWDQLRREALGGENNLERLTKN